MRTEARGKERRISACNDEMCPFFPHSSSSHSSSLPIQRRGSDCYFTKERPGTVQVDSVTIRRRLHPFFQPQAWSSTFKNTIKGSLLSTTSTACRRRCCPAAFCCCRHRCCRGWGWPLGGVATCQCRDQLQQRS